MVARYRLPIIAAGATVLGKRNSWQEQCWPSSCEVLWGTDQHTPIVLFLAAVLYVFVISHMEKSMPIKIGICIGVAYLGLQRLVVAQIWQQRFIAGEKSQRACSSDGGDVVICGDSIWRLRRSLFARRGVQFSQRRAPTPDVINVLSQAVDTRL
jgi:hypothetical protein